VFAERLVALARTLGQQPYKDQEGYLDAVSGSRKARGGADELSAAQDASARALERVNRLSHVWVAVRLAAGPARGASEAAMQRQGAPAAPGYLAARGALPPPLCLSAGCCGRRPGGAPCAGPADDF
jgi:hypothetical protein